MLKRYIKPAIFFQNQIGHIATNNKTIIPTKKRLICGSTQGTIDPPATEYSIVKPTNVIAQIRIIIGQFRYRILEKPEGIRFILFSRYVIINLSPSFFLGEINSFYLILN